MPDSGKSILIILGIETSTEACSVALMNSDGIIFSEFEITPRQHTRYLPSMLNSVLQQAGLQRSDISYIAYASGPGAFTGVRIATATAQGLAIGLGISLVPVSTLAVLAQQACDQFDGYEIQVALDARMDEAYTALYVKNKNSGLVELSGAEQLIKLEQLEPLPGFLSAGSGFRARFEAGHSHDDKTSIHEEVYPTATALVKLAKQLVNNGLSVSADKAEINYIRNKVAEKKRAL